MLFSTIFNPFSLLMGLRLLSGVTASPMTESELSLDARSVDTDTSSLVARDLNVDQIGALNYHNARRKQLGIPPLVWDTELEAAAQKYVQSLADTQARYIISRINTRFDQGENSKLLIFFPNEKINNPMTTAAWYWMGGVTNYKNYGGKNKYDLRHQGDGADYYTQAIWRATTKVGIATARQAMR
ncbi:plant PR-1 class of pathogen related [Fusarium subglutinans]|uniref:Plant PR-1 class of pathogen related n=1 Tax=Gibberella subglutinans TaxID=42677 RepID=A0A8H5NPJ3_GIBSU|nr:plant PR-1 class of pathogen related [Fusarium subglutinans]KAF5574236.1 plant PR-1 class of pathogen related [Fusarium subglutinans]